MKNQILALSTDERNFLRDPPAGVPFHFESDSMYPVALATLKEDKNLSKMRFQLVPKKYVTREYRSIACSIWILVEFLYNKQKSLFYIALSLTV